MDEARTIRDAPKTLHRMWQRLGDSSAVGLSVALLYFPFGLAGPLWIDPDRVGGSVSQWLVVALVGQAALTLTLVVGQKLVYSSDPDSHHPIINLALLTLAVFARAVAIAWFAQAAGVIDDLEIQYRIRAGIFAQTSALIFLALLMSAYTHHKRLISNLAGQQKALDDLNNSIQDRLAAMQHELRTEVRQSIDPLIAQLDSALRHLTKSTNVTQVQEYIRRVVDNELRPLSHKLASPNDQVGKISHPQTESVKTRMAWPKKSSLNSLIRPLAIGIWVGLLAGSQGLRLYSLPYAIFYSILSGVLVGVMLFVIRLAIGKWRPPTPLGIMVTFGLTVLAVAFAYQLEKSFDIKVPDQIGSAAYFAVPLMSLITAIYSVIVIQRESIEIQLSKSIDDRMIAQSGLRQREYIARQRLGYVIHGTLQTSLNAAAMRLAGMTEPDMNVIEMVRADIARAVAKLDEPTLSNIQLIDTLNDISSTWENACDTQWSMDHKTVRILVDAPDAALSVTEIVREGVANAIRHGGATEVRIKIAGRSNCVVVSIVDNGSGIPHESKPGLGSRMLDQTCFEWDRRSRDNETHLVAQIAT